MSAAHDCSIPGLLLLLGGSWLAAAISGVAGFGGALLLLPVLVHVVGPLASVPLLTLAQLVGNLSRAGLGWREIQWQPVGLFLAGALPAAVIGAALFTQLSGQGLKVLIAIFLIVLVALRRLTLLPQSIRRRWLVPGGALVGFLSGAVGSAGPLGAALFLSLNLMPLAYIASEAVTALAMHCGKMVIYQRSLHLNMAQWALGLGMGAAMFGGTWTGRRVVQRLNRAQFLLLVDACLIVGALSLLVN